MIRTYTVKIFELLRYFKKPGIEEVSATTDLWTSSNHLSMMTVTLNLYKEKFEMFRRYPGGTP